MGSEGSKKEGYEGRVESEAKLLNKKKTCNQNELSCRSFIVYIVWCRGFLFCRSETLCGFVILLFVHLPNALIEHGFIFCRWSETLAIAHLLHGFLLVVCDLFGHKDIDADQEVATVVG